ncbi:hypothetical protein TBLA_0G02140 [Henningerozyma blattae CBS 6284]|uniref:Pre-rRNA-processing protein TSR2 n=1 Tax=Henningerozyma blattae (strain ATCC 34711 / CBS 6284 / DSM 70876 / NBRC 10599 / NRRL Y-10934 / UCD 77-7) TaxID=1071380 RepID=I2H703_HENB6|nr:hypothetical protein TBLA_0G02140 [Tetrapisispora blattae CBS 6284]CCH62155.1 hypothetical protein TBLA_0G02140 [Tetrapisispora blattae CBS 6284]
MNNSQFDVSDFVEASKGKTSLKFQDAKQQGKFELGVTMMIYKWEALDIAVENQWGGLESSEKRDWLNGVVIEAFMNEKIIDVEYIEEILLNAMIDEFDVNVEDDSALPIAAGIIELYKQCDRMDYATIDDLYSKYLIKQEQKKNSPTSRANIHINNDPLNPDISSSEEESENELEPEDMDVDMEDSNDYKPPAPVVDDDGFELVQKKGKGRRH